MTVRHAWAVGAATLERRDLQHTSALVMVPPPHTWPRIQQIRAEKAERGAHLFPPYPHITTHHYTSLRYATLHYTAHHRAK